ncbi:MAG: hypothetical protein NT036_04880 [Candidatus Omnitrophica bacterium]|nr:hypothetical protein [Candidatus Omnitrophota bacterium]
MRFSAKLLIILSVAILLYGCDSNQYQAVTGPDGALYRFDKKTGSLTIMIKDKGLVTAAQPKKAEVAKEEYSAAPDKPVSWKESKYPGKDLKAKFEMVWREGKLCYKFSVYPYKSLEKAFARKKQDYIYSLMKPGFNVELLDKNGFLVKEIKISLWNMAKVDDDSGAPKELVLNSQIDCTGQSYSSIGGCVIKWALESEMIEDDNSDYIKSSPIKSER